MNRKTWIAVVALVSIAAVYVVFFRKTDEDLIRAQLRALAEAVAKSEGENEMLRALRVEKAFQKIFTPEVDVKIPEISERKRPRGELATLTIGAGHAASQISLRYESVRIEVDKPKAIAWVTGIAIISGARMGGLGDRESREMVMRFDKDKEEKAWRIASVEAAGGPR